MDKDKADEQERREDHLKTAIESANQALKVAGAVADLSEQQPDHSFFYISSWPVDPDGAIQSWATTGANLQNNMMPAFEVACNIAVSHSQPDLIRNYPNLSRRRWGWRVGSNLRGTPAHRLVDLEMHYDGRGCLIMGGAATPSQNNEPWIVNANAIVMLAVRALVAFGVMYDHADFKGPVDIGVAVTGIAQQTLASDVPARAAFLPNNEPESITVQDDYKQTRTIPAQELTAHPMEQARYLLWPLLQATAGEQNPFSGVTVKSPQ